MGASVSGNETNKQGGLGISQKVLLVAAVSLLAVFAFAAIFVVMRTTATTRAEADRTAQEFASLVAMAVSGFGMSGDMATLEVFLKQARESKAFADLHVVRAPTTVADFQARASAEARDELDKKAIETRQAIQLPDTEHHLIRYVLPSLARESCLQCHAAAKLNDVLGVTSVSVSTESGDLAENRLTWTLLAIFLASFVLELALLWLGATLLVARPIRRSAGMFKDLYDGDGDLTKRLAVTSRDEIGEMAEHFNGFAGKVHRVVTDIRANTETLASSSSGLLDVSSRMSSDARNVAEKTTSVVTAVTQMTAHSSSMKAQMEASSASLVMVAAATEEMTATVGEIAANSEKARSVTNEAARQAREAQSMMDELGRAAQEIGKVTEAITSIASQTNLLALNATIESARAGAAGKGFAVVASEIKDLAQQAAHATDDIRQKVSAIQSATAGAVLNIGEIARVIGDVDNIVTMIATAIEEQSAVTKDIASNIAAASSSVRDTTSIAEESARVSDLIGQEIDGVNSSSSGLSDASEHVRDSAAELSTMAGRLQGLVHSFRV